MTSLARHTGPQRAIRRASNDAAVLLDATLEWQKPSSRLLALDCEVVGSVADGGAVLEAVQRLRRV